MYAYGREELGAKTTEEIVLCLIYVLIVVMASYSEGYIIKQLALLEISTVAFMAI